MPRLILDTLWRAIGMLHRGATHADVANQFGVHRHIVQTMWTRYQYTGLAHDRPRYGRPRVTSQSQDVCIRVVHLRNGYQTAEATARTIPGLHRIRGETVRNCPRAYGICPRRPCVRSLLLSRQRRARRRRCIFVLMHTLATESENTALSSHVLWRHQRMSVLLYLFQICCVLKLYNHYSCVKISLRYVVNRENGG